MNGYLTAIEIAYRYKLPIAKIAHAITTLELKHMDDFIYGRHKSILFTPKAKKSILDAVKSIEGGTLKEGGLWK